MLFQRGLEELDRVLVVPSSNRSGPIANGRLLLARHREVAIVDLEERVAQVLLDGGVGVGGVLAQGGGEAGEQRERVPAAQAQEGDERGDGQGPAARSTPSARTDRSSGLKRSIASA